MGAYVADRFLWVDLETTGTDEQIDLVLEVGAAVTDREFNILDEREWLVRPGEHWEQKLVPFVREMHERSGLLDALAQPVWVSGAKPVEVVADELLAFAQTHETRAQSMQLAGSGVSHFDLRFLRLDFPAVIAWLYHAPVDIGHVRRFLTLSGWTIPDIDGQKRHRALSDARDHVAEACVYRDNARAMLAISAGS